MATKGSKNNNNNSVPTLTAYIAAQIANKRAAALDKSRNRTSIRVPMLVNETPKQEWETNLLNRYERLTDIKYHHDRKGITVNPSLKEELKRLEKEYAKGYSPLIPGPNCIYNAGDCYGLNIAGNVEFASKARQLGFKKGEKGSMEPGDIVQDVKSGRPVHAMIYDSKDKEGNLLFNYARGYDDDDAFDINKNYVKQGKYPLPIKDYDVYKFVGTQADSTQWTNDYKRLYGNQMKCGGRRKAQLGLAVTDGGTLIPIDKNMFLAQGRTHDDGGIGISYGKKYNAGGDLEIENKEVLQVVGGNTKFVGNSKFKSGGQSASLRVFSSVPFLRGVSPAELVMGGANPDTVFKAQEEFKDRNRINDDGTRYEVGGEKIYTPNKSIQRQIQETGKVIIGGAPTIGGVRTRAYMYGLKQAIKYPTKVSNVIRNIGNKIRQHLIDKSFSYEPDFVPMKTWKYATGRVLNQQVTGNKGSAWIRTSKLINDAVNDEEKEMKAGGIYIKPSKRGTFTAAAKKRGMGVQEFASKVLANKEDYSPAMVKKANFARNASRWKKELGGDSNYYSIMERVAKDNYKQWGFNNEDEALMHVLNDNTYNYRGYYNKYPNSLANADTHWTDEFKTVYHPTFSIESIYSGNKSIYNPLGLKGGYWDGDNFVHAKWQKNKKELGGSMIYTVNGNVKNGLMSARPKAQLGKTVKINIGSYETVDEAVERYKQLYRIRYGKEPSKNDINRVAWTKSLENTVNGNPNLIIGYGPNIGVRGLNVTKIVSNANKGRQIARTQTAVRNKNVKSTSPKRQAVNTKISEAARAERQSQFDAWQQGEAFKASTMPTDAVAVNRPTIGTGVRSGRRGRVDDIVAIERSQRGVDPLSSKPKFGVYDKTYAKKVNGKMNQFANVLLGSGTGAVIVGNTLYDKEQSNEEQANLDNNLSNDNPVNSNIKIQSDSSSTRKVNNKLTVNKNTNNTYVSTTKPNTGESYIINPLTGEWIRNGVTETSEPSVEVTTKFNSRPSATPRRGEIKPTSSKPATKVQPNLQDTVNQITRDAIYRSNTPKIDLSKAKMPTFDVSQLGSRETKAAKAKLSTPSTGGQTQERLIGQYKPITIGDWIGLGSNVAGSIASYLLTQRGIDKIPDPIKPVMTPAAKLKTRYDISAPLSELSQGTQLLRALIRRNTQSSSSSLAREQRVMNEAQESRNRLYGQKENAETQLINQDRMNRQTVAAQNTRTYNDYLNRIGLARQARNQARLENINNLISGLTGSVNNILGNIETRKSTNRTLRAIAAANPNVDARLIGDFDEYYGAVTKRKYDKYGNLISR